MGFLSWLGNTLSGGFGDIVASGINAFSNSQTNRYNAQSVADTNATNRQIAESTNASNIQLAEMNNQANMALNRENIAFQQQENEITRAREDNAVQRRAQDLASAGLSKTLSAGSPASANALQAPQNTYSNTAPQLSRYEMKAFQKKAFQAELAGLNNSILSQNQLEANIEGIKAHAEYEKTQAEYQRLINDYVDETGTLPSSNQYIVLFKAIEKLVQKYFPDFSLTGDSSSGSEGSSDSSGSSGSEGSSDSSGSSAHDEQVQAEVDKVLDKYNGFETMADIKNYYNDLPQSEKKAFLDSVKHSLDDRDSTNSDLNGLDVTTLKDFINTTLKSGSWRVGK